MSLQLIEKSLLPPVYAKLQNDAQSRHWQRVDDGNNELFQDDFDHWIDESCSFMGANEELVALRQFLEDDEKVVPFPRGKLPFRALDTLYYLVIKDTDAPAESDRRLQIYIGKAESGVRNRWRDHCTAAQKVLLVKKCNAEFSVLCDLCRPYQLVDCFLALAWMRQFNMALFIIRQYRDAKELQDAEAKLIRDHAAKNTPHGLNCKS